MPVDILKYIFLYKYVGMVFVPFVYVSGVHLDVYYNRDVSVIHPVHGAINLCLFLGTLPTFFTNQRLLALQTISFI